MYIHMYMYIVHLHVCVQCTLKTYLINPVERVICSSRYPKSTGYIKNTEVTHTHLSIITYSKHVNCCVISRAYNKRGLVTAIVHA